MRVAKAQGFNPSTSPAKTTVSQPIERKRSTRVLFMCSGSNVSHTLGAPSAANASSTGTRVCGLISSSPIHAWSPMKSAGLWKSVRPARSASHCPRAASS